MVVAFDLVLGSVKLLQALADEDAFDRIDAAANA